VSAAVDPCVCPVCGAGLESIEVAPDGPGTLVDRCVCERGHEVERVFALLRVDAD